MPDISQFEDMDEWMQVCVPMAIQENGGDRDAAIGKCMGMWTEKSAVKYKGLFSAPVKAVGDWELDVTPVPFTGKDSDGQWFDPLTDIMHEAFQTPLIVYQHGIKQGAKGLQDKPMVIGKTIPGSLEKQADGWHLRVVLNKALKVAKDIMEAAKRGMVAVSSGSISHLARLEVNGKLIQYEKNRPGRIAVWALGEVSLWERGNGNVSPASPFAIAMPVMKAMYRDAGLVFPDIPNIEGDLSEAEKVANRARIEVIQNKAKTILKRTERFRS